jgi:xanthine dehydrogenase accessory factor
VVGDRAVVGKRGGVGDRVTGSSILAEAAALERRGEPFVLATVVWRRAPSSGRQGAKTIIRPDGTTSGWIGGACAGPTVVREAVAALADGRPRLLFLGPAGELDGGLRTDVVNVPMACESEGALELYLEPVLPHPQVLVIGGSPAVRTLVELAAALGWRAEAVDDADLGGLAIDGRTAVVVATQGHYDEDALEAALATNAGYVGLVASAARAPAVLAELEARGVDAGSRSRVRAPAGLDLGRIDHAEIAVAVLAELVALKASGGLGAMPAEAAMTTRSAEAVDPVCGMTVTVSGARHVVEHEGDRWYFCSTGCQRAFQSDPDKYSGAGPGVR